MENVTRVSKEDAIKIVYYLMAVDGEICQAEEDKFDAIANEIDSEFDSYRTHLITACQNQLNKVIDHDEYYEVIQEGVGAAIDNSGTDDTSWSIWESRVSNKLIVWNLLTIAFSDNRYSYDERKLIKYVTRRLNLDKAVFLEMENTIKALNALEREEKWLRTTTKPYGEIEKLINELQDRKNVISQSAKDLIAL